MFKNAKYLTRGVQSEIPVELQLFMWSCIKSVPEPDYLQIFRPEPIFFGENPRYFGVELEIDGAGKDDDNAKELLEIANENAEHIYIKSDGSLDDGMEIVTHLMSLNYHKNFCWENIMKKAIYLGYRSHQTSTCGLHIHVNRKSLGLDSIEQEDVIGRILYFVEHHWNADHALFYETFQAIKFEDGESLYESCYGEAL